MFKEDAALSRFPFSIVWTPLPLISWLLPFVGHLGIADSRGVIYDFAGPFTISVDSFAFGAPVRVLRLHPERAAAAAAAAADAGATRAELEAARCKGAEARDALAAAEAERSAWLAQLEGEGSQMRSLLTEAREAKEHMLGASTCAEWRGGGRVGSRSRLVGAYVVGCDG